MSFLNTFQTQSKEDATKALFDVLNNKAMDVLSSMKEESVQIDELSKNTLGSYIKKSTLQAVSRSYETGALDNVPQKTKSTREDSDANYKTINKRLSNIPKAVNRLTKEDTESLDEGTRGIGNYSKGRHQATTYKDSDTGEYRVKFSSDGKWLKDADYFTDDKDDAAGTAKHQVDKLHASQVE